MSRWLTPKATAGLKKTGDVLVPGNGTLPSFSGSGLLSEADRILDYLPETDRTGLIGLAEGLSFAPVWLLRLLFWVTVHADCFPGVIASPLRQVEVGLKGFIFTLYYSNPHVREQLGWTAKIRSEIPE